MMIETCIQLIRTEEMVDLRHVTAEGSGELVVTGT